MSSQSVILTQKQHIAEYRAWCNMRQRCNNPKVPNFPHYGGRGIKVCKGWDNDFSKFLADLGTRPTSKHSLDRINNNLGYSKSNCRWATRSEQNSNKRKYKCAPREKKPFPKEELKKIKSFRRKHPNLGPYSVSDNARVNITLVKRYFKEKVAGYENK